MINASNNKGIIVVEKDLFFCADHRSTWVIKPRYLCCFKTGQIARTCPLCESETIAKSELNLVRIDDIDNPVLNLSSKTATTDSKFSTNAKYFIFGTEDTYKEGLQKKIDVLNRSMEEECISNDNGKWKSEYMYIVYEKAKEMTLDKNYPHRIRDKGHSGMTLLDFQNHVESKRAGLSQAEVAALRMYTGPFYIPWNTALRMSEKSPRLLKDWKTCISVLYSAIFKLSFSSERRKVYRGINESERELHPDFYTKSGTDFAGGVELAFMSTSTDLSVALEYASRGSSSSCSIFEITFDIASRGASVVWLSQYPYENELLYPPYTCLTCDSVSTKNNIRYLSVRATVSSARPNTFGIETVTDRAKAALEVDEQNKSKENLDGLISIIMQLSDAMAQTDATRFTGQRSEKGEMLSGTLRYQPNDRYGRRDYTGEFASNLPDGSGTMTYLDGHKFTGTFCKGRKASGVEVYVDGDTFEGEYKEGNNSQLACVKNLLTT